VRLDTDASGAAQLTVEIEATDAGSGVREVQLLRDGAAVGGADTSAPFAYGLNLGPGQYQLVAVAVDHNDNSAESTLVNIGVDMEPPTGGGGAGDDGGDDDGGGGSGGGNDGADDGDDGGVNPNNALPSNFGQPGSSEGCSAGGTPIRWGWLPLIGFALLGRRRRT